MGGHFGSHGAKMVAQSAGRPQCFDHSRITDLNVFMYYVHAEIEIITLPASRLFLLEGKTSHVDGRQTCGTLGILELIQDLHCSSVDRSLPHLDSVVKRRKSYLSRCFIPQLFRASIWNKDDSPWYASDWIFHLTFLWRCSWFVTMELIKRDGEGRLRDVLTWAGKQMVRLHYDRGRHQ